MHNFTNKPTRLSGFRTTLPVVTPFHPSRRSRALVASRSQSNNPDNKAAERTKMKPASVPGDLGWDPLRLRKNKQVFERVREAEVIHARWAMLGVLSLIFSDMVGHPVWPPQELSVETVLPWALAAAVMLGILETYRLAGVWKEPDFDKRTYPGKQFDMLGFTKSNRGPPAGIGIYASWVGGIVGWLAGGWWFQRRDLTEQGLRDMKGRELGNGRLAMVSFLGCCVASLLTGKGPYTLLLEHVADPLHNTVVQVMWH